MIYRIESPSNHRRNGPVEFGLAYVNFENSDLDVGRGSICLAQVSNRHAKVDSGRFCEGRHVIENEVLTCI